MLRSYWILGFLALIVNTGTLAAVFLRHMNDFLISPEVEAVEEFEPDELAVWNFRTTEIQKMVGDLNHEKEAMKKRAEDLDRLEAHLFAEKKELERLKKEIEGDQDEILQKLVQIEESEVKNLKSMVATFANMKPESVVSVFNAFEDEMIAKLLFLMKPAEVGLVFEELLKGGGPGGASARRVAQLTEKLRLLQQKKAAVADRNF